jgi:hypothetical protein
MTARSVVPLTAPATALQRSYWSWQVAGWQSCNIAVLARLRGRLDRGALVAAIDDLFRRHEALRTTLAMVDGQLLQQIWPHVPTRIADVWLRAADSLDDEVADEAVTAEVAAPFDLTTGASLCRVSLFRAAETEDDHVLALVLDHSLGDAASCELLAGELEAGLAARREGAPPAPAAAAPSLRDYSAWERSDRAPRHETFWRTQIAPTGSTLPMGCDDPAPRMEYVGSPDPLAGELVDRLGAIAAQQRTGMATVVFAAMAVAFSPWHDDAVRIGVVCANRFDPAFRTVVGPLINLLPLRIDVDPAASFAEIVTRAGKRWMDALVHNVPLEVMYEFAGIDDSMTTRLHDVSVNFVPYQPSSTRTVDGSAGALEIALHPLRRRAIGRMAGPVLDGFACGVECAVDDQGRLSMAVAVDPHVLPPPTADALGRYLADTLTALALAPDTPVRELVPARPPIPGLERVCV